MHAAEAVSSPLSIVSLGNVGGDGGAVRKKEPHTAHRTDTDIEKMTTPSTMSDRQLAGLSARPPDRAEFIDAGSLGYGTGPSFG